MPHVTELYGVEWVLDPLNNYAHALPPQIVLSLGYIPSFLSGASELRCAEQLQNGYPYWNGSNSCDSGARILMDGRYTYPGDPPQVPAARALIAHTGEYLYFYPHAMVGIVQPQGDTLDEEYFDGEGGILPAHTFLTRMD